MRRSRTRSRTGQPLKCALVLVLLGTSAHADEGLMRAHWTASGMRDSAPADWNFLEDERPLIRDAVIGRASDRSDDSDSAVSHNGSTDPLDPASHDRVANH